MKLIPAVAFMLCVCCGLHAQTYVALSDTSKTLNKVDVDPDPNMLNFKAYVLINAEDFLKPGHSMGSVKTQMFIEKDGKINYPVVTGHLSPDVDSAVVKTLRSCPPWVPGSKNGKPVRTLIKLDFVFAPMRTLKIADPGPGLVSGKNADVQIDQPVTTEKPSESDPNKIYTAVEQIPAYPGGISAFYKYLSDNNRLKGKDTESRGRVIVRFVVETDGSITNAKIVRGVIPEFDAEALRLINAMPKWKPGIQNGRAVRVQYSVPVSFNAEYKRKIGGLKRQLKSVRG